MKNHSLPHECDGQLRNLVIKELLRQRRKKEYQKTLEIK